MTHELSTKNERELLTHYRSLVADRDKLERQLTEFLTSQTAQIQKRFDDAVTSHCKQYESRRKTTEDHQRRAIASIETQFEQSKIKVEQEYHGILGRITNKARENEERAAKALQEAHWLADAVFEGTENQPDEEYDRHRKGLDGRLEALDAAEQSGFAILRKSRQRVPHVPAALDQRVPTELASLLALLDAQCAIAADQLKVLNSLRAPRLFRGPIIPVIGVIIVGVAVIIALALNQWKLSNWVYIVGGVAMIAFIALAIAMYIIARAQIARAFIPLSHAVDYGRSIHSQGDALAQATRDELKADNRKRRDDDIAVADKKFQPVIIRIRSRRKHHVDNINRKYPDALERITVRHDEDLRAAQEKFTTELAQLDQEHESFMSGHRATFERERSKLAAQHSGDWTALQSRWSEGVNAFQQGAQEILSLISRKFPPFTDSAFESRQPSELFNTAIPFGTFAVDTATMPGGLPQHESLVMPAPSAWGLPAMLTFPDAAHLFIETADQGRAEAVALLQTVMFRLLTSLPPGKVHFTLIDSVSLGQNLAGFMHLADYDGRFVTDRIWTEDRHIDQRLLDLTEHMETVIQKYLRNEYATIAEYNQDAGEIAEPYRILVIAGFPVNFTENAARRLASIISSGPRCGVHALIAADTRLPLPQGIQLADLQSACINLKFENGRMIWKDDEFQRYPLTIEAPPSEALLTRVLHKVGALAKNTIRVEVPFAVVAATETEMWSQSTAEDVRVALGRAGATKLQYLSLGQGTSQHALVAGKTGSGKSTLLHALVTNLALWYNPREVEFYLVDFKKGVEFKTYASHKLPHARVVAIESDREFGLSVLQRLDAELKRRGEMYRDLNVQDVAGFRRASPDQPMPRVLLIVDEFQELFTEDDKIAQDAALLLDRLVRQGRAFGMHVVLGSQTLGGAYSLARSTLGQMGVRIALQCSEADSYLILSDDNAAARLLSRPGEAIYNDASGLIEGNSPFQVVWLPESTRDSYLARVSRLADAKDARLSGPPIIFEGNIPADMTRNQPLAQLVANPNWGAASTLRSTSAWLGDAIAIKPPTAATFARQSGANLMMVGQRDESALALLATSLISLAAQHHPSSARFYVLDGSTADSPYAGELQRVAGYLPHDIRNVAWRDVPTAVSEIHAELTQRQHAQESNPLTIYVLIYSLQRYRMLRAADEFSFAPSDPDAPPATEKQFADMIREGPPLGIHTLLWCDTPSNLTRALERQALRDFEQRVLFQMSAADSSNLIDSPVAARLGMHRAFFFSEEHGVLEKFRPYAFPTIDFLESLKAAFQARASAVQPHE